MNAMLDGVQAASAFASAGGSPEGNLEIRELRIAMIMVLGRAVKESEAESRLHAVREKRLPRQTQQGQRRIKEQPDLMKVQSSRRETELCGMPPHRDTYACHIDQKHDSAVVLACPQASQVVMSLITTTTVPFVFLFVERLNVFLFKISVACKSVL